VCVCVCVCLCVVRVCDVSSSSYDMHVSSSSGSKLHVKQGKLNLVDLAGSERQGKTGATGLGFRV
jgi:hypothetical protein